jgi:DNA-binding NtrC family response regulator
MESQVLAEKKILIVDDEPDILETLEEMLSQCRIDKASNFTEAKKLLNKNAYDVAIFDIMGVRGYDLLEIANKKKIPAVMLTAHALSADDMVRSIKGGAQVYVPKERMYEIPSLLAEILTPRKKGDPGDVEWVTRLKPYFDGKFGPDWQEKHKAFWNGFGDSKSKKKSRE